MTTKDELRAGTDDLFMHTWIRLPYSQLLGMLHTLTNQASFPSLQHNLLDAQPSSSMAITHLSSHIRIIRPLPEQLLIRCSLMIQRIREFNGRWLVGLLFSTSSIPIDQLSCDLVNSGSLLTKVISLRQKKLRG